MSCSLCYLRRVTLREEGLCQGRRMSGEYSEVFKADRPIHGFGKSGQVFLARPTSEPTGLFQENQTDLRWDRAWRTQISERAVWLRHRLQGVTSKREQCWEGRFAPEGDAVLHVKRQHDPWEIVLDDGLTWKSGSSIRNKDTGEGFGQKTKD